MSDTDNMSQKDNQEDAAPKQEPTNTNYENKFKILYEHVSDNDSFNDTPHGRVAKYIAKVITDKSNNKGITIGLEGGWGTGKSTIIDLLKKELGNDGNSELFIFDAWAHEGDSLRRVFLESLAKKIFNRKFDENLPIKLIKEPGKTIDKTYYSISGKYSSSETHSNKYMTWYARFLSMSALFIPIGSIIFNLASKEGITFTDCSAGINWLAWIGFIGITAPVLVTLGNIIRNCYIKYKHKNTKLSIFDTTLLEDNENRTKVETFTEGIDRTSVEFETFFNDILELYYGEKKNTDKKLVIVIDNLDRIEPEDAKKIWSTLQTFLQYKSSTDENKHHLNNLFIIIPYDSCGIAKIWDNRPKKDASISKSFLDKSFQLRIDVPKISLTNWKKFAIEQFKESLTKDGLEDREEWKHQEYIDDMVDVLARTREGLEDIPTPREIKTYINQVNSLRQQADTNISNEAIACYVIYRYIKELISVDVMMKQMVGGVFPNETIFDKEANIKDISGLIFHTDAKVGYEMLLSRNIYQHISDNNSEEILNLANTHKKGFWNVLDAMFNSICNKNISNSTFNDNIRKDITSFILKLSAVFHNITFESDENNESKERFFNKTLRTYIFNNLKNTLTVYSDIDYNDFILIFNDLSLHKIMYISAVKTTKTLLKDFEDDTTQSKYDIIMESLKNIGNTIKQLAIKSEKVKDGIKLSITYKQLSTLKISSNDIFKYVIIDSNIIPSDSLGLGRVDDSDLTTLCETIIVMFEEHNNFEYDLTELIKNLINRDILKYIEFVFKFIHSSDKYSELLKSYLQKVLTFQIQNYSTSISNRQKIFYSLFIALDKSIPTHSVASSTWQSDNMDLTKDALAIFSELKNYKSKPQVLFFNVAMDTLLDYKLAINVCFDMYKKPYAYYVYKPLLEFIGKLSTVFKSERIDEFIIAHKIDNDIYKAIIETQKDNELIDLNYKSSEINKICEISNNKDLHERIAMLINSLPADSWKNLFTNTQSGIIKTAIIILNKIGKGFLSTNYLSAFENITKTILNLSAQTISNEMWQKFINLLETNSRTVWKDNLSTHILSTKFNLHASFIELNFDYFNYKKIARIISADELDLVVDKLRNILGSYDNSKNVVEVRFYISIILLAKTNPSVEYIKSLEEIIGKGNFKDTPIEKDIAKLLEFTKTFTALSS